MYFWWILDNQWYGPIQRHRCIPILHKCHNTRTFISKRIHRCPWNSDATLLDGQSHISTSLGVISNVVPLIVSLTMGTNLWSFLILVSPSHVGLMTVTADTTNKHDWWMEGLISNYTVHEIVTIDGDNGTTHIIWWLCRKEGTSIVELNFSLL